MAKSPRKAGKAEKSTVSLKLNPNAYRSLKTGGKNLRSIKPRKSYRRLSIADSSDSDSDGLSGKAIGSAHHSDSESSLTAMSEEDEVSASRRASSLFDDKELDALRNKAGKGTKTLSSKAYKSRKRMLAKSYAPEISSDEDMNASDASIGLEGIYSAVANSDSEDESQDDNESSSSDDSELDFVKLQAEKRRERLAALKGVSKPEKARKKSFRRRSELLIPEDLNFKFEFDDAVSETAVESDPADVKEEEDLGEELIDNNQKVPADFQFGSLIDVPKIKDEELESDEDYEFDDNALLATLQADNDLEDFLGVPGENVERLRQGSLSSVNEDDTEDPFLREEEKYLVNEFETNGFDEETSFANLDFQMTDTFPNDNSQTRTQLDNSSNSDTALPDDIFESDNDDDLDDCIDYIDFDSPIFDNGLVKDEPINEIVSLKAEKLQVQKKLHHPKKKSKKSGPLDSDDEDDLYLWNYFFSSDANSSSDSENEVYDAEEQLLLDEVFKKNLEEKRREYESDFQLEAEDSEQDLGYDSGDSTDVDHSLPAPSQGTIGSKGAKEVLSLKTADYRPPVLGTWAAIDSKPFGIIDGLSTRTLNIQQQKNPRTQNWRSYSIANSSEDLAIELEELLNVSELDNDDENDVRIWRDFNNKKQVPLGAFRNKSHMNQPVVMNDHLPGYNSKVNANFNGRRRHSNSQMQARLARSATSPGESKQKLRKASIADAVQDGYRPTKFGLFSENVLADVEEVLGEDRDFMALVTGL